MRGGGYRGDDSVVDDAVALLEIRAVGVTVAVVVARVVRGVDDDVADAHQVVEQCLIRGRVADHQMQMAKAIADNSPLGLTSDFSPEAVEVAIDFLSSELHAVLFPTAADQAQGQREVVRSYETFLIDTNSKGITKIPNPYWFAVLLVGAANFAVAYSRDEHTFDRDALVSAIVELQRRGLEL